MKLNEIQLTETIDNYLPGDEEAKAKIAPEVFAILTNAYKDIGGLKTSGLRSPEDMVKNIPMWKIFRKGTDIKVVKMYKDTNGRKSVAMGTDGSIAGKRMLGKMIKDEFTTGRAYAEVSGPALKFIMRQLGDEFDSISVPANEVQDILPNKEIRPVDDYTYQRKINGEWIAKRMVGTPGNTITKR